MKPTMQEPIKVIIADDHVLYRAGVKTALSSKKDIKIIAEADNFYGFLHSWLHDLWVKVVFFSIVSLRFYNAVHKLKLFTR